MDRPALHAFVRELASHEATFIPFTAQTRMSGVDLDGRIIRKGAADVTEPMKACGSQDANDPCLESTYKSGTEFHYVVVMETDDPDIFQAAKGVVGPISG